MKVILMAAGRGTRISKEINNVPKCTLPIGDTSLIKYTIELFLRNKIEVCVVIGFNKEVILEQINNYPVEIIYNPFYDVTNSIASLWFAKNYWDSGDILFMNADVYIEQDTVDLLVEEQRSPVMLVDSKRIEEGDFFFKFKNDILINYGKQLPVKERSGEYVGIAKLNGNYRERFLNKLENMISKQMHGEWWENVLYSMSSEGEEIFVVDIGDRFWSEIDYIEDFIRIEKYIMGIKEKKQGQFPV